MIEINLIPDVKYQLLKARRMRTTVISVSIMIVIAAATVLALLAAYVFIFQTIAMKQADDAITKEFKTLSGKEDLAKTLTIQNQLTKLSSLHDASPYTSRLFAFLSKAVPTDKNAVSITNLKLDTQEKIFTIEAQARNGYEALEVFKKTMAQTKMTYTLDGETQEPVAIASNISDKDPSYGQNSEGQQVLRFTLSFTYADELFNPNVKDIKIDGPSVQNATDSAVGIPDSLFTNRAKGNE